MKLEKRRYDDVVILRFVGEFDASNLQTFSPKIDQMIEAGDRQIVLDLHMLKFVNSSALGYLIKANRRAKELGGDMVIARPSKFISKTLSTLGLDSVFAGYQTVEDGILRFKKGESIGKIDLSSAAYDETLTGLSATGPGATVLFTRSSIIGNTTGALPVGAGSVSSYGTNSVIGNGTDGNFSNTAQQ